MQASIVDLRYRSSDVLAALELGEEVLLLYHGKPKGTIKPIVNKTATSVVDHPFFGMNKDANESVEMVMESLRGGRYDF